MRRLITRLLIPFVALLTIIGGGTVGFILSEGLAPLDALYFTIVTLGTVGYGDIYPVTVPGKVLVVVLIVLGVGVFTGVIVNTTGFLLERRQEKSRRDTVNTLIGLFYSQMGTELLRLLSSYDPRRAEVTREARIDEEWTEAQFTTLRRRLEKHDFAIDNSRIRLEAVRDTIAKGKDILVRLLENPSLLEHESFTELLLASYHMGEELQARGNLAGLPVSDVAHLVRDARRVYALLALGWSDYTHHLKKGYPYLFSLALRMNPFEERRSPIVKD